MPPKPIARPRQKRIPLQETTANTGGNQATLAETWARAAEKKRMLELDATSTDHPNVKREKNADVQQASDIPKREETAVELVPYKTIITISRKSSKVSSNTVKDLHTRNKALRDFVILKLIKHDVAENPVDFLSLVFNNYSSNYNISETTRRTEISLLRRKLDTLDISPQARTHEVLLCYFTEDGFFTNLAGIFEFFRVYVNVPITMMVFEGGQNFSLHPMKDVLAAIKDVRENNLEPTNRHQKLVIKWVAISVTKEMIASTVRDLRRIAPDRRNGLRIDLDDCSSDQADDVAKEADDDAKKDSNIIRPGKTPNVYRHAVHQAPDGRFICPYDVCTMTVASMDLLHRHIFEHCKREQKCVLCPTQPPDFQWPGNRNWIDHIQRHLPPTYSCKVGDCDKIFVAKGDLTRHLKSHDKSGVVTCEMCGSAINSTFMKQHLTDHCSARNKLEDSTYKCGLCGETFNDNPQLYKHYRKAHKRRDEILGIAEDAGLLAAGIPGLDFDASASIQDSVNMHLARERDSTHQEIEHMEIFEREKMSGLKTGDAVRSLREL